MGAKGATDYQVVDAQGDADEDKSLHAQLGVFGGLSVAADEL